MPHLIMLDIYRTLFKTMLSAQLQYRGALLIWLIGFVLEPIVYMVVWMTVAASRGGAVGGFTREELAAYFIVAMVLNHLTFDWHFFEMELRVRNGTFSPLLLRPLHPIHADVMDNLSYKLLTLPFMLAAAGGLCAYFGVFPRGPLWAWMMLVPATLLAMALRFILEWTLALAAFWTTRTRALNNVYILIGIFFSGRMAPLSLLPKGIAQAALFMPFRMWISFPVELALGRLTPAQAWEGLALQCAWIGLAYGLFRVVWWRGAGRYAAVGG